MVRFTRNASESPETIGRYGSDAAFASQPMWSLPGHLLRQERARPMAVFARASLSSCVAPGPSAEVRSAWVTQAFGMHGRSFAYGP